MPRDRKRREERRLRKEANFHSFHISSDSSKKVVVRPFQCMPELELDTVMEERDDDEEEDEDDDDEDEEVKETFHHPKCVSHDPAWP